MAIAPGATIGIIGGGQLGRMMTLKYVPELRFEPDTSFEVARQVDDVLRSPRVARDLVGERPDED